MSIIKMVTSFSAATLSTSSIDVPASGFISTITVGVGVTDASPVTGEGVEAELSFLSTPAYSTNDLRGSLCQVATQPVFVDAARIAMSGSAFCVLTPIRVKVNAGERIFLHATPAGSIAGKAIAYLYIDDGIDVARAQTRRR